MVVLDELFHYSNLSITLFLKSFEEEASLVAKAAWFEEKQTAKWGRSYLHGATKSRGQSGQGLFSLVDIRDQVLDDDAFYHARFTMVGQIADNLGMYALVLWFLWSRIRLSRAWYVLMVAASGAFLVAFPTLRRHLFALLTVVLLTVILRSWRSLRSAQRRLLGWAIGIFVVATVVWVLDITGLVCDPNSIIQLHALWHLLGAVVVWMLYRAFRP